MRLILLVLALVAGGLGEARAQDLIASYTAFIGPQDRVNSRGVRLTDFGAILQQDRANFHQLGLADELDYGDPVFSNPDHRARIPDIWLVMRGSEYVVDRVLAGQEQLLSVWVYGSYGEPVFIIVMEGAG